MTSFADLALALALAPALAVAAEAPPALEAAARARLVAAIAARLDAPADRLVLEVGPLAAPRAIADDATLRLAGGVDGRFVATFGGVADGPVAVRVRALVRDSVAVAARPIGAGERLRAADIARAERLVSAVARGPAGPREGWEAQRPIATGETLAPPAVRPPRVVAAGERVRLEVRRGAVRIERDAVALADAREGARLLVRLEPDGERRRAVAIGPGAVALEEEDGR